MTLALFLPRSCEANSVASVAAARLDVFQARVSQGLASPATFFRRFATKGMRRVGGVARTRSCLHSRVVTE